MNEIIKQAVMNDKHRPQYAYIAPQYKQAKRVAWDYVRHYAGVLPDVKFNESELRCDIGLNDSRIYLLGADSPDALRGLYLDGVVLDEVEQMPRKILTEVILPALSDREGFLLIIGTAKGQNLLHDLYMQAKADDSWHADMYRASETDVIPEKELENLRKVMTEEEYAQEMECSFTAAISGAYYGKQIESAENDGRILTLPYDPAYPVHTSWDLGIGDDTAIWFIQHIGREYRAIDYYASSGVGLPHYADVLSAKGYSYGTHYAPHDIEARELGTGKSRKATAATLGINFKTVPQHRVDDGIDAVRNLLPAFWFDREKTGEGVKCLRMYQREWNDKMGVFRAAPRHDWASHGADALRTFAMGHRPETKKLTYSDIYGT